MRGQHDSLKNGNRSTCSLFWPGDIAAKDLLPGALLQSLRAIAPSWGAMPACRTVHKLLETSTRTCKHSSEPPPSDTDKRPAPHTKSCARCDRRASQASPHQLAASVSAQRHPLLRSFENTAPDPPNYFVLVRIGNQNNFGHWQPTKTRFLRLTLSANWPMSELFPNNMVPSTEGSDSEPNPGKVPGSCPSARAEPAPVAPALGGPGCLPCGADGPMEIGVEGKHV